MSEKKELTRGEQLRKSLMYTRKNGYDRMDAAEMDALNTYCEGYKQYLDAGKTERECVDRTVAMAEAAGFRPYVRGTELKPGDKVYRVNRDKAITLAVIGKQCHDPVGVDGVGINGGQIGMLLQLFLDNAKPVSGIGDVIIHLMQVFEFALNQPFNALAAFAGGGFGKDGILVGHKGDKFIVGQVRYRPEVPADIVRESLVELLLLVENVGVVFVVEQGVEPLVAHAGQISVALPVVHSPESEDQIVIITGAIADGAVDDIQQGIELALPGLFVDTVDDGE